LITQTTTEVNHEDAESSAPEMAVRLSIAFNTTAESWLNQQVQYDLWQAERKRKKLRVKPLAA